MAGLNSVRVIGAVALYLSTSMAALSAPATDEEAKRLTTLLQSYTFGYPDIVSVKPAGASYDLMLDFKSILTNFPSMEAGKKMEISISPLLMKLTDQGQGKWLVQQNTGFDFSFKIGTEMNLTAKVGKVDYAGVFDEGLGFFESSKGTFADLSFLQNVAQGETKMDVVYSLASLTYDSKNERAADGTVGGVGNTQFKGFKEAFKLPANETSGLPIDLAITVADGAVETRYGGLNTKGIYELVQWFIANAPKNEKPLNDAQIAEIKPLLVASLPVFKTYKTNASYNDISVASLLGQVGLAKVGVLLELNGFVKDGLFREAITFEKLTLPEGIVPLWAKDLVTDRFVLDFQITEFDALAAAQLALDRFETLNKTSETPEFQAELLKVLLPSGGAKFTINDYAMQGKTYDIKMDGSVIAGKDIQPKGKGTLTAKSLTELVAAINAIPAEMNMSGASIALTGLAAMAKKEADGSLRWDMDAPGDGKFLVNGVDYAALAALAGGGANKETPNEATTIEEEPAQGEATDEDVTVEEPALEEPAEGTTPETPEKSE